MSWPVTDVPDWTDLPKAARADLSGSGFDAAFMSAAAPPLRLTVLNMYAKLSGMGLWKHVVREDGSELGNLHFIVDDLDGLLAELRKRHCYVGGPKEAYWDAREKRVLGSLHIKHFPGWPGDKLQAHIDRFGFWLRWWWWFAFPVPSTLMLMHIALPESYKNVARLRRVLLRQGHDRRVLLRPGAGPGPAR